MCFLIGPVLQGQMGLFNTKFSAVENFVIVTITKLSNLISPLIIGHFIWEGMGSEEKQEEEEEVIK